MWYGRGNRGSLKDKRLAHFLILLLLFIDDLTRCFGKENDASGDLHPLEPKNSVEISVVLAHRS